MSLFQKFWLKYSVHKNLFSDLFTNFLRHQSGELQGLSMRDMNLSDVIKNISICISEDERKSCMFETTWGWTLGWTSPLTFSWSDLVIILQSAKWQPNYGTKTHLKSSRTGTKAVKLLRQNLKSNSILQCSGHFRNVLQNLQLP